MSANWDFYFCRVDDKAASIYVDLGLASEAPLEDFGHAGYISLTMQNPRPDGLSSREEFDTLASIEDALTAGLASGDAIYVGRNTSDSRRDFWFYLKHPSTWQGAVGKIMKAFPAYTFEANVQDDPSWKAYFEFLYPAEEDLERIENRRVCEQLEKNGDSLTEPRDISHWIYFPESSSRSAFTNETVALGFKVEDIFDSEHEHGAFGIEISRVDVPKWGKINEITLVLSRAAKASGGRYDGWECQVVD